MLFGFLNGGEIIVILVVVLILFGGSRLPQLGEALGKGIRNFRKSVSGKGEEQAEEKEEEKKEIKALPPASKASQEIQEVADSVKQEENAKN